MTVLTESAPDSTRRVRPWLAALLTFLGWGVGLYYARRKSTAVYAAIGQVFIAVLIGGSLVTYLAISGPVAASNIFNRSMFDGASLALTAAVAVCVWVFVAKNDVVVKRASSKRLWGYFAIWLLPIFGSVFLALLIRFFVWQPFNIPSGSMTPTLQVEDYLVAQKWSYGYSRASLVYPLTRLPLEGRMLQGASPKRGDVVVFKNRKDGNKDYINRVIGLPGDQIQMIAGVLHINGEPVKKDFIEVRENACGGGDALLYRETLDNGASYLVQECSGDEGVLDNVGPYSVPEGHYFMMGDNRDQSQDSRIVSVVGYISYDDLVGKVLLKNQESND